MSIKRRKRTAKTWFGEWADLQVNETLYNFLKKMCQAKTARMILHGSKSETQRTLTPVEMSGIKDVLMAYDVLK